MKRIILSEAQLRDNIIKEINSEDDYLRDLVKECISNHKKREMLFEDRESKNMKKARNVVRQYMPNANAMEIITAIRNDIPNSRINHCEYLPGVTRMYMNGELYDGRKINELNALLKILGVAHANEYNNDLNGMSADELISKFSTEVDFDYEKDVEAHSKENFTINNDYCIVRIESTQDAWPYSKYTDWCITSNEPGDNYDENLWVDDYGDEVEFDPYEAPEQTSGYDMYKNYTHETGVFYFILKKGFEKIERKPTEGCPLDEYGLSMIATSVDERGRCNTITCRWNHAHNANDEVMTPMELSKLIGRDYYKVFKPYTLEERKERGIVTFDEFKEMLKNGFDVGNLINKTFEYKDSNGRKLSVVEFHDLYNIYDLDNKSFLFDKWYDSIKTSNEHNLLIIEDGTLTNFLTREGDFLFDTWFNGYCRRGFNGGIAEICSNEEREFTLINREGKILTMRPIPGSFEKLIGNFVISKISFKDTRLFTLDRKFICKLEGYNDYEPYNSVYEIGDGYLFVSPNRRDAICVRDDGSQLQTRMNASRFVKVDNSLIAIDSNSRIEIYSLDGKLVVDNVLVAAKDGWCGVNRKAKRIIVKNMDGKFNIFDCTNLNFILNMWVDDCLDCNDLAYCVLRNKKWIVIDCDGKLLTNKSFDNIKSYRFPLKVEKNNLVTFLFSDGELLGTWFDDIQEYYNSWDEFLGIVNGKKYIIDTNERTVKLWSQEYENHKQKEYYELKWEKNRDY